MGYWYPILGWAVFWVGIVISIILLAINKKLYPVLYVVSVALYIFTAGYIIDFFELGKLGILSVLIFSALIFMVLGFYLSKVLKEQEQKA